jgi:protein-tyrosine phosphatase
VPACAGPRHRGAVRAPIDLHCHILPGIDDGARDMADAVEMARQAERDGIGAICATPHIRADHDVRVAELPARLAALAGAVKRAGCPTDVLTGGEVAEPIVDDLGDAELRAVTLGGGGRWILLEPAPGPLGDGLVAAVRGLHGRGFRCVIAHPERHIGSDLRSRLAQLIGEGALIQATAAALTDAATQPAMLGLAEAGLIHVLGSDSHSALAGRPVALTAALELLATVRPIADEPEWVAAGAPGAIIAGADITPPFPATP